MTDTRTTQELLDLITDTIVQKNKGVDIFAPKYNKPKITLSACSNFQSECCEAKEKQS